MQKRKIFAGETLILIQKGFHSRHNLSQQRKLVSSCRYVRIKKKMNNTFLKRIRFYWLPKKSHLPPLPLFGVLLGLCRAIQAHLHNVSDKETTLSLPPTALCKTSLFSKENSSCSLQLQYVFWLYTAECHILISVS